MNLGLESEKVEFKKSTSELIEGVISIASMLNKHVKIFSDLDYIDQTGHGIPLIVKNYGKDAFYISEHTVIVTIPLNKELLETTGNKATKLDLNEAEIKVLELIKNNSTYKTADFVRITEYSEAYINKIIRSLKDKDYIKRMGSNKNGYWDILK